MEADTEGAEIDVGLGDGQGTEEGSQQDDVSPLVDADLMGDSRREDQVVGLLPLATPLVALPACSMP